MNKRAGILLCSLAIAGCSGGDPVKPVRQPSTATGAPKETAKLKPVDNPMVDVLRPGTQAIVILDDVLDVTDGVKNRRVLIHDDRYYIEMSKKTYEGVIKADQSTRGLSPGVRVTIGDDPVFYEVTQKDIDTKIRLYGGSPSQTDEERKKNANFGWLENLRKIGPRKYSTARQRARRPWVSDVT